MLPPFLSRWALNFLSRLVPPETGARVKLRRILYKIRLAHALRAGAARRAPECKKSEKSRHKPKKRIVVIDDRIPHFDMAAGDRNTWNLVQMLVELDCDVKFIPHDSTRPRPYADLLRELGVEIVCANKPGKKEWRNFIKQNGPFLDFIVLNRPHIGRTYLPDCRRYSRAKIIYCCQDLHFVRLGREQELRGACPAPWIAEFEREEIELADSADLVLTVSCFEKKILDRRLKKAFAEVSPIFIYKDFPRIDLDFSRREDLIFVGGASHAPNLDALMWFCREILPVVSRAIPGLILNIVGADQNGALASLEAANVIRHGHLDDAALAALYKRCRIAIVPLRYGAGVKGKLVEAMYHGLPVVATGIGLEGLESIDRCLEGADSGEEFAKKIITLYNNKLVLRRMAVANQEYVKDFFSHDQVLNFFSRCFSDNEF